MAKFKHLPTEINAEQWITYEHRPEGVHVESHDPPGQTPGPDWPHVHGVDRIVEVKVTDWIVAESEPGCWYPIDADVMKLLYEDADAVVASP